MVVDRSATTGGTDGTLRQEIGGTGVTLERLAHEALTARESAFAPHSGFKVGAALLTPGGRIFRGANVEAAAYSMTNCAERVTIQKAVSEGERSFIALAVAADASYLRSPSEGGPGVQGEDPGDRLERFVTPCGACRQVIFEFGPEASIVLVDLEGGRHLTSARELLPGGFRLGGFRA